MKDLLLTSFFETSNFCCKNLFLPEDLAWDPLKRLQAYLKTLKLGVIESPIPSGVFLENEKEITIKPECLIEPGAFIRGPCFIGRGSEVRSGAYIRGGVLLGERVTVGHGTEVKSSILFDGAAASHFNYVGDSILGRGVNLGAGAKLANLRLDRKEVSLFFQHQRVATGLQKLGAILGDFSQIGCNAVLNPGTLLFPHAKCLPCKNFSGVIS